MLPAALRYRPSSTSVMAFGPLLLAAACGPGQGSLDTGPSTATATDGGTETTGEGATTSATASSTSPTPVDDTAEGSTTAGGGLREHTGFWSTGFGVPYFTPCGEQEAWYAEGLPGFEVCDADPFFVRVLGMELPPLAGDATPRIEVVEILEGPCLGGSCDGSVPVGECDDFEVLCGLWNLVECDLVAQDCPRGLKCAPWSNDGSMAWNSTHCTPVEAEVGQPGDPCTVEAPYSGFDDCALGAVCWDADPVTHEGVCVALCDQALMPDPGCPGGTSCTSIFAQADPAGVCLPL